MSTIEARQFYCAVQAAREGRPISHRFGEPADGGITCIYCGEFINGRLVKDKAGIVCFEFSEEAS